MYLYRWTHYNAGHFPPDFDGAGALHGAELDYLFEKTLFSGMRKGGV